MSERPKEHASKACEEATPPWVQIPPPPPAERPYFLASHRQRDGGAIRNQRLVWSVRESCAVATVVATDGNATGAARGIGSAKASKYGFVRQHWQVGSTPRKRVRRQLLRGFKSHRHRPARPAFAQFSGLPASPGGGWRHRLVTAWSPRLTVRLHVRCRAGCVDRPVVRRTGHPGGGACPRRSAER